VERAEDRGLAAGLAARRTAASNLVGLAPVVDVAVPNGVTDVTARSAQIIQPGLRGRCTADTSPACSA
jgi:hypothetical protein